MFKSLALIALSSLSLVGCLSEQPVDDANRRVQSKGFTYACGSYFLADPANQSVEVYNLAVKGFTKLADGAYSIVQDPQNIGDSMALALWVQLANDNEGVVPDSIYPRVACSFLVSKGNVVSNESDPSLDTRTDQFDDKTGETTLNTLPLDEYSTDVVCDRVIHEETCGAPNESARSYENIIIINQ